MHFSFHVFFLYQNDEKAVTSSSNFQGYFSTIKDIMSTRNAASIAIFGRYLGSIDLAMHTRKADIGRQDSDRKFSSAQLLVRGSKRHFRKNEEQQGSPTESL